MQPLYITIDSYTSLVIIPDSEAHVNGHPVITYTYSVYRNDETLSGKFDIRGKYSKQHLEKQDDESYLGYITFELPGKIFTYTPNNLHRLNTEQIEQLVEEISHYRDTPSKWWKQGSQR
ncbi:hypothetical protein [Mucilaginibacter panaciglaebae]